MRIWGLLLVWLGMGSLQNMHIKQSSCRICHAKNFLENLPWPESQMR